MTEVVGENSLDAWQQGVRHLLNNHSSDFNLMVTINNPTSFDERWLSDYDPQKIDQRHDHLSDVINTVLPTKLLNFGQSREIFYSRYLSLHRRARKFTRNKGTWGTYFERLIDFGPAHLNQLEIVIEKLRTWPVRATTAFVFHPTCMMFDRPRTRGGPCWQFGELLWQPDDVLDFVVVYRNHDYFNKALGNFIAHGNLLNFLCKESGKTPGKLMCHSVHAYYDVSRSYMRRLARI